MKKSLVALAFGTLALGIRRVRHDGDFALCRRRLACEHSDCRASDFRLCARRVRRGPGADFRTWASAQADFADIGMPDDRGQSVRCGCARLRRADVGALRFGTASRSLFRRGLDRCREAGRRGKRRRGRVDHDRGHDGRQPVRRAARHDAQRGAVLAGYFPAGGLLGVGRAAVRLALGAAGRRFARYRLQGAIPFLSQKGALAVARSDSVGQRRRILLVQLYQSAADSRCGFPGGRRFGADGAGRIRHVRRQLGRRPPCRTAIRRGGWPLGRRGLFALPCC